MSYIYQGSFLAPGKRKCPDGRRLVSAAIRDLHRGEPLSAAMQKRAVAERPSAFGVQADETLQEIKKVQRTGRRMGLPQHTAQGDAKVGYKSLSMVKRARKHALPVTENRLPSASELNKAFSEQPGKVEVNLDELEPHRGYATGFRAMSPQELRKREMRKVAAPQSANGTWDDTHANSGAKNDWRDQITPSVKPTRITFPQFSSTPGQLSGRDAAVEAIKQDLSKPKRMGASPNVDDSFTREG